MTRARDGHLGIVARFLLLDGHERAFDILVAETVEQIAATEEGALVYLEHSPAESGPVECFMSYIETKPPSRSIGVCRTHSGSEPKVLPTCAPIQKYGDWRP